MYSTSVCDVWLRRPIYLQREYGYDQVQISWVYQAFAFGGLCSGLLCARLSRRIWERTLLLSGQIVIGVGNIGYFFIFYLWLLCSSRNAFDWWYAYQWIFRLVFC